MPTIPSATSGVHISVGCLLYYTANDLDLMKRHSVAFGIHPEWDDIILKNPMMARRINRPRKFLMLNKAITWMRTRSSFAFRESSLAGIILVY